MLFLVSDLFYNHLHEEKRADCFEFCYLCHVVASVLCVVLAVLWFALRSPIVSFPGHTHFIYIYFHILVFGVYLTVLES